MYGWKYSRSRSGWLLIVRGGSAGVPWVRFTSICEGSEAIGNGYVGCELGGLVDCELSIVDDLGRLLVAVGLKKVSNVRLAIACSEGS